ncbi:MAG: CocE/NonD family hydrolase [Firmicutes bacterium]|nr:CocE/NonD family hydrolase [Bacillota bacterium]
MAVRVEREVPVPMRDGVVLRANVFRPAQDGSFPVLLTRVPYGKDGAAYGILDSVGAAELGYVVVVQDVRGRGSSQGEWRDFEQEFADGQDTLNWVESLPYCNGSIGMFGGSYYGFTQLAAASWGHPCLKAIVPVTAFDEPFDGVLTRGGALEWGLLASWFTMDMAPEQIQKAAGTDPDTIARFSALVAQVDRLTQEGYWTLPVADFDTFCLPYLFPQLREDIVNPTAAHGRLSLRNRYSQMRADALVVGGWYDVFLKSTLESYAHLAATGCDVRLVVGPWTHTNQGHVVGDLNFGVRANSALRDLTEDSGSLHLRWFDWKLRSIDSGFEREAPVSVFETGSNRWLALACWPPSTANEAIWYLHSGGHANSVAGNGWLSESSPGLETCDRYVFDPQRPVMTRGGNILMSPDFVAGPVDQGPTEARSDVLVYTSHPFVETVRVAGNVRVRLWVESSAVDTDFVARICDVHADGRSYNLADGIVRMRYRGGMETPTLIEPERVYVIEIDLWDICHAFLPGHRLRLQITSSNFPRWNRHGNTAEAPETSSRMVAAQQVVRHDAAHPSCIRLPVVTS